MLKCKLEFYKFGIKFQCGCQSSGVLVSSSTPYGKAWSVRLQWWVGLSAALTRIACNSLDSISKPRDPDGCI